MYNFTKQNPIVAAASATIAMAVTFAAMYILFEPTQMFAAATGSEGEFTVSQEIGAEISFATAPVDLTTSGTIGGATGGAEVATSTVEITTNNSTGYILAIKFESATGMERAAGGAINYYGTTTADYNMNLGVSSHGFAYSVSSTNQVAKFNNDGSGCNTGSGRSASKCYTMHGTPTSDITIVDSSGVATAEETIIGFKAMVAPGSGLANGFYYATTTLTATTNP